MDLQSQLIMHYEKRQRKEKETYRSKIFEISCGVGIGWWDRLDFYIPYIIYLYASYKKIYIYMRLYMHERQVVMVAQSKWPTLHLRRAGLRGSTILSHFLTK